MPPNDAMSRPREHAAKTTATVVLTVVDDGTLDEGCEELLLTVDAAAPAWELVSAERGCHEALDEGWEGGPVAAGAVPPAAPG